MTIEFSMQPSTERLALGVLLYFNDYHICHDNYNVCWLAANNYVVKGINVILLM